MIANELINPRSIVVIGGSNSLHKPGGKIVQNLLAGTFEGALYVVNPKEKEVQGIKCFPDIESLPETDLAILAIAAAHCTAAVRLLADTKRTKGFIILSAGFAEESPAGAMLEREIAGIISKVNGTLIGPNCIGVINRHYQGVFTDPRPQIDPLGCDFISGSGATAVFIMEAGISNGLTFSSVYSVGNSAQTGVEEVLAYMDESFDPMTCPKIKLLYIENINHPGMLLRHAQSLIRKGCRIAAIKAGTSEAGSRAASSHTGAMASPDLAVDALFRKAGIVRCFSRAELVSVASVFRYKELKGKNLAIITHAGGPAVMLTDALSEGGLGVPVIAGPKADELLSNLHPGSSTGNPIDFLATGTADQLETIISYCENYFDEIDGMIVIYGSPGLFPVNDVYRVVDEKISSCRKPLFPVLPSVINARAEISEFLGRGRVNFPDEVALGRALARVYNTPGPAADTTAGLAIDATAVRNVVDRSAEGYLPPAAVQQLLDAAGIPRAKEWMATTTGDAAAAAARAGFPVVMKVIGPVHKSDVGGVSLDIRETGRVKEEFGRMMTIPGATAVLIQPMLSGMELFAGVMRNEKFGHLVLCGPGGIFVEILKDIQAGLAPLSLAEAETMILNLKACKVLTGIRGKEGISISLFAEIISRLSLLATTAPEIAEMDLNPLLGTADGIVAVDARIRLDKSSIRSTDPIDRSDGFCYLTHEIFF